MTDAERPSHAPAATHPSEDATLGTGARVYDAATGSTVTAEAWQAECAVREGRSIAECREQLMNAIARGDVQVVDDGTTPG